MIKKGMRSFWKLLPILSLTVSAAASAQDSISLADTPAWLQQQIATFETLPEHDAPQVIWQLTHKGQTTYLFISPCCDQYNPLYDDKGNRLCFPTGGIIGRGDGECPDPADRGTPVKLVWLNPKSSVKEINTPILSKP